MTRHPGFVDFKDRTGLLFARLVPVRVQRSVTHMFFGSEIHERCVNTVPDSVFPISRRKGDASQ